MESSKRWVYEIYAAGARSYKRATLQHDFRAALSIARSVSVAPMFFFVKRTMEERKREREQEKKTQKAKEISQK